MSSVNRVSRRFQPVDELSASINSKIYESDEPDVVPGKSDVRVKTRFLNFRFKDKPPKRGDTDLGVPVQYGPRSPSQIGTLTIVGGPGCGRSFAVEKHLVQIGRGDCQDVRLAFGDTAISRKCHATIAYYGERSGFLIRDGLKPNPVFLNGAALNGEKRLFDGDFVRIGETTLRFDLASQAAPGP